MAVRDPDTGQFVSGSGTVRWDEDVELVHLSTDLKIDAADLSGGTGATGGQNFKLEPDNLTLMQGSEFLDRGEVARLMAIEAEAVAYTNSTSTEDGTVRADVAATSGFDNGPIYGLDAGFTEGVNDSGVIDVIDDSQTDFDLLHRPLEAIGTSAFSDTSTGVGGAGSPGRSTSSWSYGPHGPEFDHRDAINLAASIEQWNVDDAALHVGYQATAAMHVVEE